MGDNIESYSGARDVGMFTRPLRRRKFLTPVVTVIGALQLTTYVFSCFFSDKAVGITFTALGLNQGLLLHRLFLWQLVTYPLLCVSPWNLIWSLLALLGLGSMLEDAWGSRRFLVFYLFISAATGLVLIFALGDANTVFVGALGLVAGLLGGFAYVFRHLRVYTFFGALSVPHFCLLGIIILALINLRPPQNLFWLTAAPIAYFYVRFLSEKRLRAKRTSSASAESDRFAEIDLDD